MTCSADSVDQQESPTSLRLLGKAGRFSGSCASAWAQNHLLLFRVFLIPWDVHGGFCSFVRGCGSWPVRGGPSLPEMHSSLVESGTCRRKMCTFTAAVSSGIYSVL